MPRGTDAPASADAQLAPIVADPSRAAIMLDLDGTLAPIVSRPEDAAIDEGVRGMLAAIAERYAICAIVSGRRAEVAREIVGLGALAYAGNHGLELLAPGAATAESVGSSPGHGDDAPGFARSLDAAELRRAGVNLEDKGPIVALHWRRAEDEALAEELAARIAAEAEGAGLLTHRGRMVLELRPPVEFGKGVAVGGLLDSSGARVALYAGDDRTDLDAFAELALRRDSGRLDAIVRVGVRSAEGPAEIVERADLVVDGPAGIPPLLAELAG